MRFRPYHQLDGRPNVIVDGSPTDNHFDQDGWSRPTRSSIRMGRRPDDYPSQAALLYTEGLARLPELCADVGAHRELWAAEDESLTASEQAIRHGDVKLWERPEVDLAVVEVPVGALDAGGHRFAHDWVAGLHPMAVHNATDRLVVASVGGQSYDVELRYESWVQLRSRPWRRLRFCVVPAADLGWIRPVIRDESRPETIPPQITQRHWAGGDHPLQEPLRPPPPPASAFRPTDAAGAPCFARVA